MSYLKRVAIAFDQMFNALTGAEPDETFSARCWRKGQDGGVWRIMRAVVDSIFFWQEGHCKASYDAERRRRHLPSEYSKP